MPSYIPCRFVVKYRRKVISPGIMDFFKVHAKYLIEERFRGNLIEFNGEADHVHILFELPPSAAPSMVVCSLKTEDTAFQGRKKTVSGADPREVMERLFWSDSYFLATTGGADIETLERYIQTQGTKKPRSLKSDHRK